MSLLGVRIDDKMERKLETLAKRHKRTKSYFARAAMEVYLDEIDKYEEALKRSGVPSEKILAMNDLKRRFHI